MVQHILWYLGPDQQTAVYFDTCRLGDVCVSAYSVNWDCRQASWSETADNYPNQCTFPKQRNGPSSEFLFGQCQFTNVTQRELSLADEVLSAAAAKANLLPRRNNVLQVKAIS